jgi:hypothetical protein
MDIRGGREIWPGFTVSARPTDRWRFMLNVDVLATVFHKNIEILEHLSEVIKYKYESEIRPLTDAERKKFQNDIKGRILKY